MHDSESTVSGDGIRLAIVDDHLSTIRGLRSLIDEQPGMTVVAAATTVDAMLERLSGKADLVVLDLRLEDGSSPQQNVATLREAGLPTIVFTSGGEPYLVRQAASAGVLGVLRKNIDEAELVTALRAAAAGEPVPTMDWAVALDADPGFVDLSPRLRRVLELYASGESTGDVAEALQLSTQTVSDYVNRIRLKYSAAGRPAPTKADLYKRAIEDGWLPIPRRLRH